MRVVQLSGRKNKNLFLFGAGYVSLLVAVGLVWNSLNHILYSGVDGQLFQHLFLSQFRYAAPFATSSINILQGLGSLYSPLNAWANPGYLVFGLLNPDSARVISACYFLAVYCLATFALARSIGVSMVPAIVAGQFALLAFPPFQLEAGLDILFVLNPGFSYSFSLLTLALCLLIRTTSLSHVLPNGCGITALVIYSATCDPGWTILAAISLGPAFLAYLICAGSLQVAISRAIVLAAAGSIVYLAGVSDYLVTLGTYTSRMYFRPEIHGEVQIFFNVSILFQSRAAVLTYWLLACGWLFGVIFSKGRQRLLALICILYAICLLFLGGAYLFFDIVWTMPLPRYFEQSVYHIFILGAVVGWFALVQEYKSLLLSCIRAVKRRLKAGSLPTAWAAVLTPARLLSHIRVAKKFETMSLSAAPLFEWAVVLTVPAIVLYYLIAVVPDRRGIYIDQPVPDTGFIPYLRDGIGMQPGATFRGAVTLPFGDRTKTSASYTRYFDKSQIRLLMGLWEREIPTLEVYGLVSPPLFYFTSRLLSRPDDHFWRNGFTVTQLEFPVLQALGVKFIVYPIPIESPYVVLRQQLPAPTADFTWHLYELAEPNLGNYSPTRVYRVANAKEMVELMRAPGFDFRRDAVVAKDIGRGLVPATGGGFSVHSGAIRVWGKSDGDSLIVLPIQFSNCLKHDGSGQIELIRVNLMLTGVLFHRELDAKLNVGYGAFSPQCRRKDLEELKALKIQPDRKVILSSDNWPHALVKVEDLKRQFLDMFGQMP